MTNPDYFFKKVKAEYAAKQLNPILNASSLRLELPMKTDVTSYQFPLLQSDTTSLWTGPTATEQRLQTNDNFHVEKIGFYIALTTASTDTNYRLKTYPAEVEWTAATANDIFNLYNGTMSITVQNVNVILGYRMTKHLVIPQTQRISVAANTVRDEVDLSSDCLITASPTLMLSGRLTNVIKIQLPAAITNAPAANNGRMILIFDGLTAQNAAVQQTVAPKQ